MAISGHTPEDVVGPEVGVAVGPADSQCPGAVQLAMPGRELGGQAACRRERKAAGCLGVIEERFEAGQRRQFVLRRRETENRHRSVCSHGEPSCPWRGVVADCVGAWQRALVARLETIRA